MELLERAEALGAMHGAWASAGAGHGRAVVVSGEPGIGKTSLLARFIADLPAGSRVLLGTCDDLSTARPLGPIRDVARNTRDVRAALEQGAPIHEIQRLLLEELERPPRPTLLAFEDVHWADDATLDVITVIGRRIGSLPAMLVVTLRRGDVAPDHRLWPTLAAIPPSDTVDLELRPLTEDAVASLAGAADARTVHRATGGNPFYVSELLAAAPGSEVPPSVATAVLARAARLDPAARDLLAVVSVIPGRTPISLLDAIRPGWPAAAADLERQRFLEVDAGDVRFRHELARQAIRSSIPTARRRELHGAVLAELVANDADPADIVHHAEAAGARDVLAAHVVVAARRAAALGSNGQAWAHYRRAAEVIADFPAPERATILEETAASAYLVARLDEAAAANDAAIDAYRGLDDQVAVARCLLVRSRLQWYQGDGDAANRSAHEAVAILEPLGDAAELARAYGTVSQLAMLAEDVDVAIEQADRAIALADRLHDDAIRAHAMINVGTARMSRDPDAAADLLAAHELASAVGDHHEASRALLNLAYALMIWVRPSEAMATACRALAYTEAHEVGALSGYLPLIIARLDLRSGHWAEAETSARRSLERDHGVTRLVARMILAELATRRGDPDAGDLVTELLAQASRTGEPQRIEPVLEVATQAALLHGGVPPIEDLRSLLERLHGPYRYRTRLRAWMAVSSEARYPDETGDDPYAALARGDRRAAADGFGAVGWTYDRAIALTLLDDEAALGEALEIARTLGATPLARRAMERMRVLGFAVPRGRRGTTRDNVAGLTSREQEVLQLLASGMTNAEIADRLVVSPRTAEHHVAAVLGKLGVATRREAARRAATLGLLAPDGPGAGVVSGGSAVSGE